ncbi:helix-turn-helix domain-containing protein [Bacteroides sp. 224]|uniref:helix-turn-helix domain-containing protein n=1 Tax=Bacteroides sp. 224 TaxID=2302936 RepID=UPI0013D80282|nr:helix-turn-helix transcriptional regulator [Bacteroides sp. 224]NDV66272.1 XRE family transcriptional regulator [Bacteroides sp. 224]
MNDLSDNNWNSMSDDYIARQIGAFVKHYRLEQNRTQTELAKDAGISRSTLSLLERGEVVTIATLIQTLRVLDLLHVFDKFTVNQQQSPLLLAKAEKKKKNRATPQKKIETEANEDIDW